MAEYIDRLDASTIPVLPVEQRVPFGTVGEAFEEGWRQALEMVAMMESADVVEVVRCADCKHYDCEDGDQKCVKDAEWVEDDACYYGFISYHGPEFYCADGKRKDGERDDA